MISLVPPLHSVHSLMPAHAWRLGGGMQRDDRAIQEEGVENLTDEELRSACRTRGMRAPFGEGAPAFMQRQLREWLDLSLHRCGDGRSRLQSDLTKAAATAVHARTIERTFCQRGLSALCFSNIVACWLA